jgi:Asp-tRNA(Asn)/Glu-tRNA(Gln) amidotransferase A subunit family amidase
MRSPWLLAPFTSQADAFRRGTSSPRDYLERCLSAIESREPELQAFVCIDPAAARREADRSSQRWREGRAKSLLDGLPIGVKDIIDTRDFPTGMGSAVFDGWHSRRDAACVHVLREAGAIVVGKTVTTELAVGRSGPTRNPIDPARTPAGSSSGSAAAVAAGMLPVALGSQTQSSTLRPASFCGAFGYKPTFGALPMAGVHPLAPTHDHLGVLASSLEDLWACAQAIAPALGALPAAAKPRQLAWLRTAGWASLDNAAQRAFGEFLGGLRELGVTVIGEAEDAELASFEAMLVDADAISEDILAYEMGWPFAAYVASAPEKLGERVRGLVKRGAALGEARYAGCVRYRKSLRGQFARLQGRVDALVTLSASGVAPVGLENTGARSFPIPGSLLGAPCLSLPLLALDGLPLGVQLIGFSGADAGALGFARWLAEAPIASQPTRRDACVTS